MKLEILSIKYLKQNAKLIHYFGLGFIQIKLNDKERLHIYTEDLPAIIDVEDVHNHRYSFVSHILQGELTQEIFDITDGGDYVLRDESCREGKTSIQNEKLCQIKFNSKHVYTKGSSYSLEKDTFHRVYSKNAITYLVRETPTKEFAQVISKKDSIKVCPFSKKVSEDELWAIVEKQLIF